MKAQKRQDILPFAKPYKENLEDIGNPWEVYFEERDKVNSEKRGVLKGPWDLAPYFYFPDHI